MTDPYEIKSDGPCSGSSAQEATAGQMDPKRLEQELQVHQIELEMQNQELRETQEKLQETIDRYTLLYHHSPVGHMTVDDQGRIVEVSQSLADMLGQPASLRSRFLTDFCTEDSQAIVHQRFAAFAKKPEGKTLDLALKGNLGKIYLVEIQGRRLPETSCLTCSIIDRTKEKLTEEALRESEGRLHAVFMAARNAILMMDSNGLVTNCNPATMEVLGYEPKELIGFDLHGMLVPEPYRQAYLAAKDRFRKTGQGGAIGHTTELKALHKAGHEIDVEISLSSVKIQNEWHAVGIVRDITERVNSEQRLIAARNEAERANLAKSEFLSAISHDLRTPMNAILGFGQLLQYDDSLPADHQDNIKEIMSAGYHLLDLINEILDLAKVEAGHMELSIVEVRVAPLVEECLGLIRALAARHQISMEYDCPPEVAVLADPTRLKQILLNLLSNAVKYNHEGGSIVVETEAAANGRLRIQVTDSGIGIPAERLPELFQPFSRLGADKSNIEGTGIGLTICRRVVEMMGGTIDLRSQVGSGSCFWIELPMIVPEPVTPTAAEISQQRSAAVRAAGRKYRVLYIEDSFDDDGAVSRTLEDRDDIHLLVSHVPELAVEPARNQRPDLILLNLDRPGMDAAAMLRMLKADPATQQIPVIAITAADEINSARELQLAGQLTRPVNLNSFIDLLERTLSMIREPLS